MIKKFKQTGVDLTRKANQNTRNMGPSPQPDRVKNSGITEVGNPDLDGLKIVLLRMNPSASGPMALETVQCPYLYHETEVKKRNLCNTLSPPCLLWW